MDNSLTYYIIENQSAFDEIGVIDLGVEVNPQDPLKPFVTVYAYEEDIQGLEDALRPWLENHPELDPLWIWKFVVPFPLSY